MYFGALTPSLRPQLLGLEIVKVSPSSQPLKIGTSELDCLLFRAAGILACTNSSNMYAVLARI